MSAYDMRMSDLSSDVCPSDLLVAVRRGVDVDFLGDVVFLELVGVVDHVVIDRGIVDLGIGIVSHHLDRRLRHRLDLFDLGRATALHQHFRIELGAAFGAQDRRLAEIVKRSAAAQAATFGAPFGRSEEHTSELQSLMRISYAVFCLKKKKKKSTT